MLGAFRMNQPGHAPHRHQVATRQSPGVGAWNYVRPEDITGGATLTYYLNRLQGLRSDQPVLVTLNRDESVDPRHVIATRFDYSHPVIDQDAVDAQPGQHALSAGAVSYCGAYWGFGFHEDGVRRTLAVCERFGARL